MTNPKVSQLRKKSQTSFDLEEDGVGKVTWLIRPIPTYDLLSNLDKFSSMPKNVHDIKSDDLSDEDAKYLKEQILPLIDILLPACTIDPPVTIDNNDPRLLTGEAIHIRDLSYNTVLAIFNKITEITGMTREAEEARKKLQSQNSANP